MTIQNFAMERIIRFRGKHISTGEWLYGSHYDDCGEEYILPNIVGSAIDYEDYQVDPNTVGQFTGAKDKNGNDIYEGDIIHWKDSYRHSFTKAVGHDDVHGRFIPISMFMGYDCVLLGNIYDNPEKLDYKPESEWPKNGLLEGEFRIRALYDNGCMSVKGHVYVAECRKHDKKSGIRIWDESSSIYDGKRYGMNIVVDEQVFGTERLGAIYEVVEENENVNVWVTAEWAAKKTLNWQKYVTSLCKSETMDSAIRRIMVSNPNAKFRNFKLSIEPK